MNNQTQTDPIQERAKAPGLLLHCGAEIADRKTVFDTPTPENTETWYPLSHKALIEEVETQLDSAAFTVTGESHALSHDGLRYFGVFEVNTSSTEEKKDYTWIVGLRNSHDKSYPAGLVAGTRVLVCDNMAFSGSVRISRKHTRYAMRDLRHLTSRAVGQLGDKFQQLDQRIDGYKDRPLADPEAHDVLVQAIDCRVITPTQLPAVLKEWRKPSHEVFRERNAWSLFNAVTEVHKTINPHTALARGQALHGLFDQLVGLSR